MIVIETIKEFIAKVKGFFVKHGDINKDGVLSKEDLVALKDKTKDELEEADAIISALEKEIKLDKRNFRHFSILYRTNAQSRSLEESLRRTGIPYN